MGRTLKQDVRPFTQDDLKDRDLGNPDAQV